MPGSISTAPKVDSRVVDRDRSMVVQKAYRKRKVALVLTVSKPGVKTLQPKLGYGKAR